MISTSIISRFGLLIVVGQCLAFSGPVVASSAYEDACTGIYSVQKRMCSVEHVYKCEAGGETLLRNESWDPVDGLMTSIFSEDGNWIALDFHADYIQFVEILETTDPFSFAALFANGSDSYDYTIRAVIPDLFVDPVPIRFVGVTSDTGQSRTIEGIEFRVFEETVKMELNALTMGITATTFYDSENGTYTYGASEMDVFGKTETVTGDVAQIIKPDEPGFLVNAALYDCGELS